jgi:PKD repeat protein
MRLQRLLIALGLVAAALAAPLRAATYLPMSDADLAAGAPVIVRASVVSTEVRVEIVGGRELPFTIVTLRRIEALRGSVGETFALRLPGGRVGDTAWFVPGVPAFAPSSEVVLMLRPARRDGEWHLTELALSRFDLAEDESGRVFAVRPEFDPVEDLAVAKRADLADAARAGTAAAPARDAESFLAALRAVGRGDAMPEVVMAEPRGEIGRAQGLRRKWGNIGGREPGDCDGTPCLFRWFWDTGTHDAIVTVTGNQTNLSNDDLGGCGTDATCDIQHGVDGWHGVSLSNVHISGPSASGNVSIALDAVRSFDDGAAWTTAFGCSGGVIGLGGPGSATGPRAYRGDVTFYSPSDGQISMRKSSCPAGYSARTFRTAVMHEMGHVLGLNHPGLNADNVATSIHSTTTQADWDAAVMHANIPAAKPEVPQTDDIQAIQYLYGTAAAGAAPGASFTFSPASPTAGSAVSFTDASSNSPTGWQWDFGDTSSGDSNQSSSRNPSHTFAAAGTYTVKLYAGSLSGTGTATKTVVVAPGGGTTGPCVASASTLCLNNGRFAVSATFQTSGGQSGQATGVALTADAGYFFFFDPKNVEVVLKVLNACTQNPPRYWVFAAGLTNVEVTLTVTDTQKGGTQTYTNPLSTPFAPIQDTDAFATCP